MPTKAEELFSRMNGSYSDELRIWIIKTIEDLQIINNTLATEATLSSIDGKVSPFQRTPNLIRVSGPGNIPSVTYGFSVYNSGTINATVLGGVIKPGETFNFSPDGVNNFYAAGSVTYDATGSELVIIYNT